MPVTPRKPAAKPAFSGPTNRVHVDASSIRHLDHLTEVIVQIHRLSINVGIAIVPHPEDDDEIALLVERNWDASLHLELLKKYEDTGLCHRSVKVRSGAPACPHTGKEYYMYCFG